MRFTIQLEDALQPVSGERLGPWGSERGKWGSVSSLSSHLLPLGAESCSSAFRMMHRSATGNCTGSLGLKIPPWHAVGPQHQRTPFQPDMQLRSSWAEHQEHCKGRMTLLRRQDEAHSSIPSSACDLLWQKPSLTMCLSALSTTVPVQSWALSAPGLAKAAGGRQDSLKELELFPRPLLPGSAAKLYFSREGFLWEGLSNNHHRQLSGSTILTEVEIISTATRKPCAGLSR